MSDVRVIAGYTLRESLRRRVFAVLLVLTVAVGGLYAYGSAQAFDDVEGFAGADSLVNAKDVTGATLLGLMMFTTLFLGAVLAAFLTLGAVRGDAERGLLQPLVVRPLGRSSLLLGRFIGAGAVAASYAFLVYAGAVLITGAVGGWWPDRFVGPGLELAGGVTVIAALSLLGSVFLSATANGIAVFMVFGGGLLAGLLGQIGEGLSSDKLQRIGEVGSWLLPFEALYQRGLSGIVADQQGGTRVVVELGPFGGAQPASAWLLVWSVGFVVLVGAAAMLAFARRDL